MKKRVMLLGVLLGVSAAFSTARAQSADSTEGKVAYDANCKRCHGVRGTPPKTMKEKYPKIVAFDAEFLAKHSEDSVVKVLTKGKNEDMKSFQSKLTAAQMAAVAAYVRDLASKNHQ